MRQTFPSFKILLTLLVLVLAIAAPGLIAGDQDLRAARVAFDQEDFAGAALKYESAARHLPWREDLWQRAGEAYALAGKPEESIRLLQGRAHLSLSAQLVLAKAYLQVNDLDAALMIYQSMESEYGGSAEIYAGLAGIYQARADWTLERAALQKQVSLAPEDAAAQYRLGLLLTLSDSTAALEHLLLAARLDPEFDPVVQTLRAALNLSSLEADESDRLITIGRGLALVAEWPLAAAAFSQAVGADEAKAEAWAWLGEAKQHLGQDGGAELDQAGALDPQSVIVHALRGLHWTRVGNAHAALIEYQAAAELEPENPAWKHALGETYARLGDLVSALAVYQRATELAPGDPTAWRLLATFCAQYAVQVQEVGLPAAHKAVELAPQDVLALDVLGWNQLNAGLIYSAEQTLLAALEIAPDFPAGHLHLALVYLQKGDRDAAYEHLSRVQELDPGGLFGKQAEQILSQ